MRHKQRKSPWITLGAMLVAVAVVLSRTQMHRFGWRAAPSPVGVIFSGRCISVSDGDTISVMHGIWAQKIRLFGVDAPELGQDTAGRRRSSPATWSLAKR